MNIKTQIQNGMFEKRSDTVACGGCDLEAEFYQHIYDDQRIAVYCENCGNAELVERGNPDCSRLCKICEDFVTDDDIKRGNSIKCRGSSNVEELGCENLTHKDCIELCKHCGWFCDNHVADAITCDSCGLNHDVNHFVSFGNDFVGTFGNICQDCFSNDEELYGDEITEIDPSMVGTVSDEELEAEKKYRKNHNKKNNTVDKLKKIVAVKASEIINKAVSNFGLESKRSDSSIYLSHFIRKPDGADDSYCLDQLLKILSERQINASRTGYFGTYSQIPEKTRLSKAVCLTDGRLSALIEHAQDYSYYGIGFAKFLLLKKYRAAPAMQALHKPYYCDLNFPHILLNSQGGLSGKF